MQSVFLESLQNYVSQMQKQTAPLRSSQKIEKNEYTLEYLCLRPPLAHNSRQPICTKDKSTKCFVLCLRNYAATSLQSPASELYISTWS